MTDVQTPDNPEDNNDDLYAGANEGLVKKNRELIEESRRHRSRAEDLQAERDQLHSQLMDIRLNKPVDELLKQTMSLPVEVARTIASQYVDFVLEGDDVKIRGKDGKPLILTRPGGLSVRDGVETQKEGEEYEADFTQEGLHDVLHHLSGGALDNVIFSMSKAGGGGCAGAKGLSAPQSEPKKPVGNYASQLGLK